MSDELNGSSDLSPVSSAALPVRVSAHLTPEALLERQRDQLSVGQLTALDALMDGKSLSAAAAEAGVDRGTLFRWRQDHSAFKAALEAWKSRLVGGNRDELTSMVNQAMSVVGRAVEKEDLRAALAVLKCAGVLETARKPDRQSSAAPAEV